MPSWRAESGTTETISIPRRCLPVAGMVVVAIGIPVALLILVDPLHYQVRYSNPLDGGLRLEFATERWFPLPGPARRYRVYDAEGALIAEMSDYDPRRMGVRERLDGSWWFDLPEERGGPIPLRASAGGELRLDEAASRR